uniref:Large ribosomal subunit protein uL11 N-terminal domain-containing protein n=1 Tax=Clydonella sawyeri TaxID=2201168 RepID=A0A2U9DQS6_9EUKA|nr:hypothetical protein [Clydonella sawyeri]
MVNFFEKKFINLQLPSQEAVVGQSINVALGQFGVNIVQFLKEFNEKSVVYPSGMILNTVVSISFDGSFELLIKGPSILYLLKCVLNSKKSLNQKDLVLLLFFIRKYRKDLSKFSDFALCKCIIGSFKSRSNIEHAFEK